jgi:hypothetical protein
MTLQYTVIIISLSHHYFGAYRHLIVWHFILVPSLSISESDQSINSILPTIRLQIRLTVDDGVRDRAMRVGVVIARRNKLFSLCEPIQYYLQNK